MLTPALMRKALAETHSALDGFAELPGGTVLIGSPEGERQRQEDEKEHRVTLAPFAIDPLEVTQRDYQALMGANPSYFRGEDLPVDSITWYEAAEYCNRLSRKRGLAPAYRIDGTTVTWDRSASGYRLPTEAEWEYAARAGSRAIFPVGDLVSSDNANFEGDYPYLIEENYVIQRDPDVVAGVNRGMTVPVKHFKPNAFGLYQMAGNVSEWCFDYWSPVLEDGAVNPAGPASGALRINRGGSFIDFGKHLRSAYRSACAPWRRDRGHGMRLVRGSLPESGAFTTHYLKKASVPASPRVLIAYFSYSGNTESAAKALKKKFGYDMIEIRMSRPYRGNIYEASQKHMFANARPELAIKVPDMSAYDVILLGYPTWWATVPPPVCTFLESANFAGKTILPFSSHGGTIWGDSLSDLAKMAPEAHIGPGYEFNYSGGWHLADELAAWVNASLKDSGQ